MKRIKTLVEASTAAKGVKAFFAMIMDDLDKPKFPQLCLMAGSLRRDVLDETVLQKYVVEQTRGLKRYFSPSLSTTEKRMNYLSSLNRG